MGGQTDNGNLIGPSVGREPKKGKQYVWQIILPTSGIYK